MKTPICTFDAKAGSLCSQCESRFQAGQISSNDVEASIKLTKIAERDQEINKFTLSKATKIENDYILTLKSHDINYLRNNINAIKKIEEEFSCRIWFIESDANDRRFIENLFFPSKVSGVNFFWLPDGNKLTRVILSNSKESNPVYIQNVQKIAKAARDIDMLVEYEQHR